LILTIDPNFLGHPSSESDISLTFDESSYKSSPWIIQKQASRGFPNLTAEGNVPLLVGEETTSMFF